MKVESKAFIQIRKTAEEVFEGIINPVQMTKYFISESNGRMETGKILTWKFPEFPDTFQISDIEVEPFESISFVWDPETKVKIRLEELADKTTIVRVSEGEKEWSEENIEWAIQNTAGWANFLASLKAWLEYGIELRKGAFDFMKMP